jgi:hypothetical protein
MRLDDIPIHDKARDKAWEAFIKRKDVKDFAKEEPPFDFPIGRGWYELWCQAWHRAWDDGFKQGYEAGEKANETR